MTKREIIKVLHAHSYNVEDQAGNKLIVVDSDSFDAVSEELTNPKQDEKTNEQSRA